MNKKTFDFWDQLILTGVAVVGYGLYLIFIPACIIWAGLFLIITGYIFGSQ